MVDYENLIGATIALGVVAVVADKVIDKIKKKDKYKIDLL